LLLATSGCAVHRVRTDFVGFEKAYADTSNRELLLNLARLQNHDPTYFFKMGQITSSYKMAASLSGNGNYVIQGTNGSNATGGGATGLTYENDPLFQFIPVNDETNAQLLLKQIPAETFYILYQQGWRIDQLFRLMVDRIEVTVPAGADASQGCNVTVYRNVPPTLENSSGKLDPLEDKELSGYAGFLRASSIAYSLQKHGNLALREVSKFVPLDAQSLPADPTPAKQSGSSANAAAAPVSTTPALPNAARQPPQPTANVTAEGVTEVTIADVERAAEKDLSYETVGKDSILIGRRMPSARFYIITSPAQKGIPDGMLGVLTNLVNDPHLGPLAKEIAAKESKPDDLTTISQSDLSNTAFGVFLGAVQNGFAIEDDVSQPSAKGGPCPISVDDSGKTTVPSVTARLVLRSLIGVMTAAAQEQYPFDGFLDADPGFTGLRENPNAKFDEVVPAIELQPILRINWKSYHGINPGKPTSPLIDLDYREMRYLVADPDRPPTPGTAEPAIVDGKPPLVAANVYWNRDVFRLIAALTAQVTVDTSKYPIANILQINAP
jgi:hypothetical protein